MVDLKVHHCLYSFSVKCNKGGIQQNEKIEGWIKGWMKKGKLEGRGRAGGSRKEV